jgi:hypothetical protein
LWREDCKIINKRIMDTALTTSDSKVRRYVAVLGGVVARRRRVVEQRGVGRQEVCPIACNPRRTQAFARELNP